MEIDTGVRVQVFPTSATIGAGQTITFTANVTGTTVQTVNWSVNGVAGGQPDRIHYQRGRVHSAGQRYVRRYDHRNCNGGHEQIGNRERDHLDDGRSHRNQA